MMISRLCSTSHQSSPSSSIESHVISSIFTPINFAMLPIYDVLGLPRRRFLCFILYRHAVNTTSLCDSSCLLSRMKHDLSSLKSRQYSTSSLPVSTLVMSHCRNRPISKHCYSVYFLSAGKCHTHASHISLFTHSIFLRMSMCDRHTLTSRPTVKTAQLHMSTIICFFPIGPTHISMHCIIY